MKDNSNLSLFFSIPAGANRCTIRNILRINRKIKDIITVGVFIFSLLLIGILVSDIRTLTNLLIGYTIFYVCYFFYLLSIVFLKRHCDAVCMYGNQLELNSVLHNLNIRLCSFIRFFNRINKLSLVIIAIGIGIQILFGN